MYLYEYLYIYINSEPKVDRIIFLEGAEFMLELCWVLAKEKRPVVGILVVPPGRSKTGSSNMVFGGVDRILMFKVAHFPSKYSIYPVLKNILSIFLIFYLFFVFSYFCVFSIFLQTVSKIGLNRL